MPNKNNIQTEKLAAAARDALYLTVGLGVVAAEELRVRSRRLAAELDQRLASRKVRGEQLRQRLEVGIKRLDERADEIEARVEAAIDRFEARLPEQAGHLVGQARGITRVARQQVRGLIRPAA